MYYVLFFPLYILLALNILFSCGKSHTFHSSISVSGLKCSADKRKKPLSWLTSCFLGVCSFKAEPQKTEFSLFKESALLWYFTSDNTESTQRSFISHFVGFHKARTKTEYFIGKKNTLCELDLELKVKACLIPSVPMCVLLQERCTGSL